MENETNKHIFVQFIVVRIGKDKRKRAHCTSDAELAYRYICTKHTGAHNHHSIQRAMSGTKIR